MNEPELRVIGASLCVVKDILGQLISHRFPLIIKWQLYVVKESNRCV